MQVGHVGKDVRVDLQVPALSFAFTEHHVAQFEIPLADGRKLLIGDDALESAYEELVDAVIVQVASTEQVLDLPHI